MKASSFSWVMILLLSSLAMLGQRVPWVSATHDPVDFTIRASVFGWNSTNPSLREFRGVPFTALVKWVDDTHNFAIYTKSYAGPVTPFDDCQLTNTVGCLARSGDVFPGSEQASLTFVPTVPPDDGTGPGGYEYFCQYHPFSMHGPMTVFKSPDINQNGKVDIVDFATVAVAYDSTPSSPKWNPKADLNNNGKVEIVDVAVIASVFDKVLVD